MGSLFGGGALVEADGIAGGSVEVAFDRNAVVLGDSVFSRRVCELEGSRMTYDVCDSEGRTRRIHAVWWAGASPRSG